VKTWLITDTHFGHKNVITWCNRPANFVEKVERGLDVIAPDDVLIHLGDVFWKDPENYCKIFDRKFKKILVKGNHDKQTNTWFYRRGWDFVCDSFRMKAHGFDIQFSHKPMKLEADLNIHGHFHNAPKERWEPELIELLTDRHILICLEDRKYKPVLLDSLLMKEIKGKEIKGKEIKGKEIKGGTKC